MFLLEVFRDFFELVDGATTLVVEFTHRIFQAVVDVVLYEDFLGLGYRLFDRVQLLRKVQAGTVVFHHLQDAPQVALGALQTLGDGVMVVVGVRCHHAWMISPLGGCLGKNLLGNSGSVASTR
jgi:hypothetical protein